jgi:hypothetical protein
MQYELEVAKSRFWSMGPLKCCNDDDAIVSTDDDACNSDDDADADLTQPVVAAAFTPQRLSGMFRFRVRCELQAALMRGNGLIAAEVGL